LNMVDIKLHGRVFIRGEIETVTGLHIGGAGTDLEIGGLDKAVIRNPLTKQPYIPGSSLRGKMRSQTEKALGLPQNNPIGQVTIHTCKEMKEYKANGGCPVCHVFGVPAESKYEAGPTRLVVRDVALDEKSAEALEKAKTDLLFAEIKTEVAIDRVTSAATPRTIERVPAGAIFSPAELVFSIYEKADFERFKIVLNAMQFVEDDYLGGGGSRGSGKVRFRKLCVSARAGEDYFTEIPFSTTFEDLQQLIQRYDEIKNWLMKNIPIDNSRE
jgi:CRISPR-associated protein Csm3